MTAEQYAARCSELGWSAKQAAEALGICVRQHYYYADGHTEVPLPIEKLLTLLGGRHES